MWSQADITWSYKYVQQRCRAYAVTFETEFWHFEQ